MTACVHSALSQFHVETYVTVMSNEGDGRNLLQSPVSAFAPNGLKKKKATQNLGQDSRFLGRNFIRDLSHKR